MTTRRTEPSFYLMQRVSTRDHVTPERGFDGYVSLDYMGAAEFEFGAVPESLKRIRSHADVVTSVMSVDGHQVWLVGGRADVEAAAAALPDWLASPRSKERSYLPEQIAGRASKYQLQTNCWWALGADVMLALSEDVAETLVFAIKARRAS